MPGHHDYQKDDLLITLVKENPPLYDFSHKSYKDVKTVKPNVWKKIAEELAKKKLMGNLKVSICSLFFCNNCAVVQVHCYLIISKSCSDVYVIISPILYAFIVNFN